MLDEYNELEHIEEKEEHESHYGYEDDGFSSIKYAIQETEDSLKIGPSVDALVFFWIPLGILLLAAMFLGGGA